MQLSIECLELVQIMYGEMIFIRVFLTLSIKKVISCEVRSEVDFCLDKTCTQLHPTCAVRFVGSDALSCFNAQEIIPTNETVKSLFQENVPVLIHTKFKNIVFMLKANKWVKTRRSLLNPYIININDNHKSKGSLFEVVLYLNIFSLV